MGRPTPCLPGAHCLVEETDKQASSARSREMGLNNVGNVWGNPGGGAEQRREGTKPGQIVRVSTDRG